MITVYSVGQPLALNFFVNGLSCLSTDEVKLPFYKGTCLKQPNLTLFYLIFTYLAQELNRHPWDPLNKNSVQTGCVEPVYKQAVSYQSVYKQPSLFTN